MATEPHPDPYFVLRSLAKAYGDRPDDQTVEVYLHPLDAKRLGMLLAERDALAATSAVDASQAWATYRATGEYADAKLWALSSNHTEGSLRAAFERGFRAVSSLLPRRHDHA